jgi:3-hydroxyisobutyrate dehydrogenase-like beta-hydroxyacid dehydrogenase
MNPRTTFRPRLAMLAAASALALLGACASTPPPIEQLAVGKAAVEKASGPAAAEAPAELAAARDKINRANIAYANKDYQYARQLAEQAEADASLAEAQARSVRASTALGEVRESIRQLREEMARRG